MSNKGTSIQINIPSTITSEEQNAVTKFSQAVVRYAVKALLTGTETKESIANKASRINVNTARQENNNLNGGAKKPKRKSPAKKPKSKKSLAKKPK